MPNSLEILFGILSAIFLLIGFFGGGIKVFGIEVSGTLDNKLLRFIAIALGVIFLSIALGKFDLIVNAVKPKPKIVVTQMTDVDFPEEETNYRSFQAPNVEDCLKACQEDKNCKAYTYTKENANNPKSSYCYLKDKIISRQVNGDCISGIKQYN
jgi:hypothetical protein